MPLFWLPFSFEAFEFNKLYLLFFLVSLGLMAWLAKQVIYDKEFRFRCSPLDYFVLGFLAVAVASAVFSVDRHSSIFGFYGRFSNGLMAWLSLGALYFLITNTVTVAKEKSSSKIGVSKIIDLFLWSGGLVVLTAYFSIFKVWQKVGDFLPAVMRQVIFNPTSGSLEGLAMFLAGVVVLLVGLFLAGFKSIYKKFLLAAALGLLIIIDFAMAWVVLLATLILLVALALWKRLFREEVNRLLIPIFLIIIAGAMLPFKPVSLELPKEEVLGYQMSWQVGLKAATESVKSGLLGTGLGTYFYDFAKHKPVEINNSWLWQIRFDRAGSHFAEILGTVGFLGLLSYLSLIGLFLLVSWFLIEEIKNGLKKNKSERSYLLPLLMVFGALVVGQFVYYQNITLAFTFWLMMGLAVVSWQKPIKEKSFSFQDFPELSLVLSTAVIVLGVAVLVCYYFGVNFYLADVNYQKGLGLLGTERIEKMEKAVRLNPYLARYRLSLSRSYLYQAAQEMGQPQGAQDARLIENRVAKAIEHGSKATQLQPNAVQNWESLGVVYREIAGIAQGAAEWGVKSFEKAIALEPTNPVLYTELGKLYLFLGEDQKAKEYFQKAIDKKSNYAEAVIQQALMLEREKIVEEAIQKLEGLLQEAPLNVEAMFQLGRLYFNSQRTDEAIQQFKTVIFLVPHHANAHYALGVAYAGKGEKEKAIAEFERVLELNPGNQDVIQKLENLRAELAQEQEQEEKEKEEKQAKQSEEEE